MTEIELNLTQFEDELRAFDRASAIAPPTEDAILFYGSSSIRLWTTLETDFPFVPTLNRGFGGSTLAECVAAFERVVVPCRPRAIVLYAGDNDIDQGHLPEMVLGSFSAFVVRAKNRIPGIPLAFLSIKPSPCRWHNQANIRRANELIAQYTAGLTGVRFLDVFREMIGPDGNPRRELFLDDWLHLSRAGYKILIPAIRNFLLSIGLQADGN